MHTYMNVYMYVSIYMYIYIDIDINIYVGCMIHKPGLEQVRLPRMLDPRRNARHPPLRQPRRRPPGRIHRPPRLRPRANWSNYQKWSNEHVRVDGVRVRRGCAGA